MDDIIKIDKTLASVCKGEDKKSDAMMMMAPENNWDQFLTPAPCAIALIGNLILISAKNDFTLEEKPPRDGFKLLRYPNSFQASLVQVSHAGWSAFNEAHSCMDQIRLLSGSVDDHVKNAVKYLMNGSSEDVQRSLPMCLSKVQNIADESLRLAQAIDDRFIGVMELTGELLESCTNAKGVYDEKTKDTEIAIEVARTQRESRMEEIRIMEKRFSNMENEVREAQADFREAIHNVPSGFGLIGVAVCEAVIDGVRNITSLPSSIIGVIKAKIEQNPSHEENIVSDDAYYNTELSRQRVYTQASTISKCINELAAITTGKTDKNGHLSPDMEKIVQGGISLLQQFIETSKKHISKEESSEGLRDRVLKLCDDALGVCTTLQSLAKGMTDLEEKHEVISEAVNKVKYLRNESQKLDVEARKALGRNPLENKSPHLSKLPTESVSSSAVKAANENARYKTELAKETLRDVKRRQDKAAEELKESNKKLTKILVDMAKLDLKQIDFNTIRKTLVNGIKALAEVREQWGKLVRFFQMLSNLIKCSLHTSLTDFVDQARIGREQEITNNAAPLSDIFRDILFEQALKASQVAYVVHTIAATYVQVSNEHLMDRIASLGRLVALDAHKNEHEIQTKREELHNECREAQRAIVSIVMKQKADFNAQVEERIAKIQNIEKTLPPIELERIKEIQANVMSGMAVVSNEEIVDLV